ncbi:hypothetical protein OEA41_003393 [Lepraria neglecta]|uniref:6-phosphogluconate dehydrogenase NADP-binding domain-containing protein n=1 Tax=Lepraria neglecta TaxID=209136 RepID=A0AAE0DIV1_9LECA|nr:hypothetical protein OEA41_003393 [Lepraria neglecta]
MMRDSRPRTFGFVGLGNTGSMMAFNLATYAQKEGLPKVRLWNLTRSKIEYLAQEAHCEIISSIEDVTNQCDIVHACLANDKVAFSVYHQLFTTPHASGTIFVDHSTLFPTTSSALQADARSKSMHFLSCPVFGPPGAAKSAGLLVVALGDASARETVKPYLVPTIGKAVLDCGDHSSKGTLMKILGNNCILGTIELLSESFTLVEKTGFDAGMYYEFILAAWVNYGKKIRDGTFRGKTGFKLDGGLKDAAYIRQVAWNHLTTAKAIGGDSLDWSACSAGTRMTAGLHPFKGEDFSISKVNGHTNGHLPETEPVTTEAVNGNLVGKKATIPNDVPIEQEVLLDGNAPELPKAAQGSIGPEQLVNGHSPVDTVH